MRRSEHRRRANRSTAVSTAGGGVVVPPFHELITDATVLQAVQSDLGITLNGSTVSAWADQSGNGLDYSQATAASQPTYDATGLNGFPTLTFDGTDDDMSSALALPAPGTTPTWIWFVLQQVSWTAGDRVWGDTAATNNQRLAQSVSTPNMLITNGVNGPANSGAPIGTWVRGEALYSNSTSDYLKLGSTTATGTDTGNGSTSGRMLGRRGGALGWANFRIAALIHCSSKPGASVLAALDAAVTAKYGASVLV